MATDKKLTARQVQVLYAVRSLETVAGMVNGQELLKRFEESTLVDSSKIGTEGLHQTAASLVRRRLLTKLKFKGRTSYSTTYDGRVALAAAAPKDGPRVL